MIFQEGGSSSTYRPPPIRELRHSAVLAHPSMLCWILSRLDLITSVFGFSGPPRRRPSASLLFLVVIHCRFTKCLRRSVAHNPVTSPRFIRPLFAPLFFPNAVAVASKMKWKWKPWVTPATSAAATDTAQRLFIDEWASWRGSASLKEP